jgi:LmbE family N-acetylglucosaminyl deacetylase
VVTVFTGIPAAGELSALDRLGGAADSADRMRRRRADDFAALELLGRIPIQMDLLDVQYRLNSDGDLRAAVERAPGRFVELVADHDAIRMPVHVMRSALPPILDDTRTGIYAPVGIGGHPDHADVGQLGVRLWQEGHDVRFYGDMPYLIRHGFPSWLGGSLNPEADSAVESALVGLATTLPHSYFKRHVIELDLAEVEHKVRVAKRYETEFEPANRDFGGMLTDLSAMRFEVYWTVVPVAPTA